MNEQRPQRPPGLSLALIAMALVFGVLPLLQTAAVGLVALRLADMQARLEADGVAPIAMGGEFLGVSPVGLAVQTAAALGFLALTAVAWRGGWPPVRLLISGAVLLFYALTLASTLPAQFAPPNPAAGFDAGQGAAQSLNQARLVVTTLIVLYAVWYMNRAPARAFFNGRYPAAHGGD
jgi:hypothetical protein